MFTTNLLPPPSSIPIINQQSHLFNPLKNDVFPLRPRTALPPLLRHPSAPPPVQPNHPLHPPSLPTRLINPSLQPECQQWPLLAPQTHLFILSLRIKTPMPHRPRDSDGGIQQRLCQPGKKPSALLLTLLYPTYLPTTPKSRIPPFQPANPSTSPKTAPSPSQNPTQEISPRSPIRADFPTPTAPTIVHPTLGLVDILFSRSLARPRRDGSLVP